VIEEAQIVVHKAHQPDFLAHLLDADVLSGKDDAQIDLATAEADPAAARDRDGSIVEGIFELWQAGVGPRRR
jgi:hypothetical protein